MDLPVSVQTKVIFNLETGALDKEGNPERNSKSCALSSRFSIAIDEWICVDTITSTLLFTAFLHSNGNDTGGCRGLALTTTSVTDVITSEKQNNLSN